MLLSTAPSTVSNFVILHPKDSSISLIDFTDLREPINSIPLHSEGENSVTFGPQLGSKSDP